MELRKAEESEIEAVATLWYTGWQEAHAALLPAALAKHRTPDSFAQRLRDGMAELRVIGPLNAPLGLCLIHADELNQLYVSALARGTGVAAALLADGEARIRGNGYRTAWLACAIGNQRAARFYEKHDWRRIGNVVIDLETPDGLFPLEVWRYEKQLAEPIHTEVHT